MDVITDTGSLRDLIARLRTHEFVTIDTEFMRERTYYPKLCLVQVASTDEAAIIDPLAEGIDLGPLLELLADEKVLKVFHAARQDIEIFYELMKKVPAPLFDTQIAAMAAGHGDQVGYEPLVREITGARVDKGSRFTDWAKRPLSEKQLTYALGDVTHLVNVYLALVRELEEEGRTAWVAEEMKALLNPELYYVDPEKAWKRIKVRNLRTREAGILRELADWREREAMHRDVPRSRVLKDDALVEIARAAPATTAELGALRSISSGLERSRLGAKVLEAVAKGLDAKVEKEAARGTRGQRDQAPVDVMDLLRVLLKRQSEHHKVAPKLLASAADLEAIALDDDADVPAMHGWRREVFGDIAIRLKHGQVSLGLADGRVTLIEASDQG